MTLPHSLQQAAAKATESSALLQDPAVLRLPNKPQLRRYEVSSLLPNGGIAETRHIAPALPIFEDAFCAFTRGSLVETTQGPIAVEDLLPGDNISFNAELIAPIAMEEGLRFAIREGGRTVGSGVVAKIIA